MKFKFWILDLVFSGNWMKPLFSWPNTSLQVGFSFLGKSTRKKKRKRIWNLGFEIYYYVFSFLELFWQPIGRLMVLFSFSFSFFFKCRNFLIGQTDLRNWVGISGTKGWYKRRWQWRPLDSICRFMSMKKKKKKKMRKLNRSAQ